MFDLTGKSALVTGASGGIGAEIARVLHAAGANVALSGTRVDPLEALAAELGSRAHVLACNLGDAAEVEALPKAAVAAMGAVDILINNAGITRDNLFMRMSDDEWQSVLDVNLTSTFRLCRGVLRGMMKARWGRIVNISSGRGGHRQWRAGQLCRVQGRNGGDVQVTGGRSGPAATSRSIVWRPALLPPR